MRKHGKSKRLLILFALILLLGFTVSGTLAYLSARTGTVVNSFEAAVVSCAVEGNAVRNTGTVPAYIRIRVVGNLIKSGSGEYDPQSPALSVAGDGWSGSDGYYYYASPVAAGDATSAVTVSAASVDGYSLNYQILAEAIQVPSDAAKEAWNRG